MNDESLASKFIRDVLFLDPTKPPFVWVTGGTAASEAPANSQRAVSDEEASAEDGESTHWRMYPVQVLVGSTVGTFRARIALHPTPGIALCNEEGLLQSILKKEVISAVEHYYEKLSVHIQRGEAAQMIEIKFASDTECREFARQLRRQLALTVKRAARKGKSDATQKKTTAVIDANTELLEDVLLVTGRGFTDSSFKLTYIDSSAPNARSDKPLYPFFKVAWTVSATPGVPKTELDTKTYFVLNTKDFNILPAMSGRYVMVECSLLKEPKRLLRAIKGPVLPKEDLLKRLLRLLVMGQESMDMSMEVRDLVALLRNLPDDFMPDTVTALERAEAPQQCRVTLTNKHMSITVQHGALQKHRLNLRFRYNEFYLAFPSVFMEGDEARTATIYQEEPLGDSYKLHLEFYDQNGENWLSVPLRLTKAYNRDLLWHFCLVQSCQRALTSEVVVDRPKFERDLQIGNLQNVQALLKAIFTQIDYEKFQNTVHVPTRFLETEAAATALRRSKSERVRKSRKTRKDNAATDEEGALTARTKRPGLTVAEGAPDKIETYEYQTQTVEPPSVTFEQWSSSDSD